MMRDRIKRLAPIRRFAVRETESAVMRLAEAERNVAAARSTLTDLVDYRAGYVDVGLQGSAWQSQRWSDYRTFVGKLDLAIEQQQDVIRQFELQRDAVRRDWAEKKAREDALEHLCERLQHRHELELTAREQKDLDEIAMQRPRSMPFVG